VATRFPDELHLTIEALLRGLTQLLPEEGFSDWEIMESSKRNLNTKILKLAKAGQPKLAFERLGEPINFWMPVDAFDAATSGLPTPEVRTNGLTRKGDTAPGKNPGYHSNVGSFFSRPDSIWFLQLKSRNDVIQLVKAIS
jgi:hypothetical protein